MATPIPTPKFIIIWLDQHIGLLESNKQLKHGFSEQTDPNKILPESPLDKKNINDLIQFQDNLENSFSQIPKNLEAFSQIDECLRCIVRLLRDVAEHFISEGDGQLCLDKKLAYSAISYFTWAKLLLERANNFDMKKIVNRLTYVEDRISYTEDLLKPTDTDHDEKESRESYK